MAQVDLSATGYVGGPAHSTTGPSLQLDFLTGTYQSHDAVLSVSKPLQATGRAYGEGSELFLDFVNQVYTTDHGLLMSVSKPLAAAGAVQATLTPLMEVRKALMASGAAVASLTGNLRLQVPMAAAGAVLASVSGALNNRQFLSGTGAALASGAGALSKRVPMAALGAASVAGQGVLTLRVSLSAAGVSSALGVMADLLDLINSTPPSVLLVGAEFLSLSVEGDELVLVVS